MQGYSLIELVIVFALILLMSAGTYYGYSTFYLQSEDKRLAQSLISLIQDGQRRSRIYRAPIILCKGQHRKCDGRGSDLLLVLKKNNPYESKNTILDQLKVSRGKLDWRFFPNNREAIQFSPDMTVNNDNGTIWYCRGRKKRFELVLSQIGNIKYRSFNISHTSNEC